MAYAAVAVGADVVEKPVSRDRFLPACEHIWSVSVPDLPVFVQTLRNVHSALGRPQREGPGLRPSSPHRVALVAARDLKPGDTLTLETVEFGKPRLGIGVEFWDEVEGRALRNPLAKGSFITWDDL